MHQHWNTLMHKANANRTQRRSNTIIVDDINTILIMDVSSKEKIKKQRSDLTALSDKMGLTDI